MVSTKSRSGIKLSETDNISQIFGNTIVANKRSVMQGESMLVKFTKLKAASYGVGDAASEGILSSSVQDEDEKMSETLSTNSEDDRPSSPSKADSEAAPVDEDSSPDTKPSVPGDNLPEENPIVLAISATDEASKKRKHKAKSDKNQKKLRTGKGKSIISVPKQHRSGANTASPATSKSRRKQKSVNSRVLFSSSKETIRIKNSAIQGKDKVQISF